jgi:hypothetical protein
MFGVDAATHEHGAHLDGLVAGEDYLWGCQDTDSLVGLITATVQFFLAFHKHFARHSCAPHQNLTAVII